LKACTSYLDKQIEIAEKYNKIEELLEKESEGESEII